MPKKPNFSCFSLLIALCFSSLLHAQVGSVDSTLLKMENTLINDMPYTLSIRTGYSFYLCDVYGDTLFRMKDCDSYLSYELIDFDQDGFEDIIVSHLKHIPGIQDFLKFDPQTKSFKQIHNFTAYPAAQPLVGTKYYYSYQKSGCADNNWVSDLFYIENFQTIQVAHIWGNQCKQDCAQEGIYIYRTEAKRNKLIESLSADTLSEFPENKLGFIKAYWTNNWERLEGER